MNTTAVKIIPQSEAKPKIPKIFPTSFGGTIDPTKDLNVGNASRLKVPVAAAKNMRITASFWADMAWANEIRMVCTKTEVKLIKISEVYLHLKTRLKT